VALLLILALAGCSSAGGTTSSGPASPSKAASTPVSSAQLKVTSTLDGLTTLPHRIHWQAFPSAPAADVSEVDFLIDGNLGWVEHKTPYFYGNDGNWLVTSFLTPGEHTFTVRVITTGGHTATDTLKASVTAPAAPPAALAGTWTRTVTPADVQKATSSQPPPPGRWQLQIGAVGWQLHDPTGGGLILDVGYQAAGSLLMRPTIEYPPYPNSNGGGLCEDTDPLWAWTYSVGDGGKTLTLRPLGHDPCGDRAAILTGTWTRTGP
jgi:hypothetical protein